MKKQLTSATNHMILLENQKMSTVDSLPVGGRKS